MKNVHTLNKNEYPNELELLIHLIKHNPNEGDLLCREEWLVTINWERFLELAMHHRVYPNLYLKLKKMEESRVPSEVIQKLQRAYQYNTFQMLHLSREMEFICKLFDEKNVLCLVLKGPVVAEDLYGDISHRTSRDLDILVQEKDLDSVEDILIRNGYVKEETISLLNERRWRKHHATYTHPEKRIMLEIHWRLHPFPSREPSFKELWDRKRISSVTHFPVSFLGREDLFLFLIGHGAREGWFRLRWLLDMDRALRKEMNWDQLNLFIKKDRCQAVVGQALNLASQLLNTPINMELKHYTLEDRARRLAEDALVFIQQIVELHSGNISPEWVKKYEQYQQSLKTYSQWILFTLIAVFYPSTRDVETLKLPESLHFMYFPLRPVLCLWRKTRKYASLGGFR